MDDAQHRIPPGAPDLVGKHGRAWRSNLDEVRKTVGDNPDDCTVAQWVIYAPWAHPVWHSYQISVIHLRPKECQTKPPDKYFPGATHELVLFALDPAQPIEATGPAPWLLPPNFCGQFIAADDTAASIRIEADVRDIIAGKLNPDTDAHRQWIARYGDWGIKEEFRSSQPMGHA